MKEKIKKILLWIVLIILVLWFVGIFIDAFLNMFSGDFQKAIYNWIGLAIFGWLILKIQKKLNIPNLIKGGENKSNLTRILVIIGILALIIVLIVIEKRDVKLEAGKIFKNVFYGTENTTPEGKKVVEMFTKIYEPIKIEYGEFKKVGESVNLSDLLEYSSFRSLERMNRIVEDLNLLIEAWISYENKVVEIKGSAKTIISQYYDEPEAGEVFSEFEKGYNISIQKSQEYTDKGKEYINKIISFYEFLIINYDYYYIDYDETGSLNIFFNYDNDISRFNKYTEEIYVLANEFTVMEADYIKYVNDYFKDYGVTVGDIESYLENQ